MTPRRTLFLAAALAAFATPVLADDTHHDTAPAATTLPPAMMNDFQPMMRTMMADPVISNRMNELMAAHPEFKKHVERMRAMMSSSGGMMGRGMMGGDGTHGSMMSSTPSPKP